VPTSDTGDRKTLCPTSESKTVKRPDAVVPALIEITPRVSPEIAAEEFSDPPPPPPQAANAETTAAVTDNFKNFISAPQKELNMEGIILLNTKHHKSKTVNQDPIALKARREFPLFS
jgi:hypothetical protein